jgi:hypothetical protein
MRVLAAGWMISGMGDRRMQLRLELDVEGEPVSGEVWLADAEPLGFTGYAGLIATLQAIRSGESGGVRAASPVEGSS